ncbi:hypothetical protein F5Y13DRAFT_204651 [Hypoxylon sp. FL1857]|nr:hypothetical protein F5Y13DRAFT_204651 [Hypoxylon sp. FL1857]
MSTMLPAGIENPADIFSRIPIAIGPGDTANTNLLIGDWNRDPSWLWPPPLFQPYCKLHFLKECSLYHLHENEGFKQAIEARMPKTKKSSKWPAKPTRIQPARRAREKNLKDYSEVQTNSRNSSPARDKPDGFSVALETRREQLQLHLPWPIYKTRLEGRIMQISETLQSPKDSSHLPRPSTPVSREFFECRYCGFEPEVIDCKNSAPRRLAPPAPMHYIQEYNIAKERIGEFGGLKFAVDMVGEHEMVVLLEMKKLSDFTGQGTISSAKEELGNPSLTRSTGSRKRRSLDLSAEQDKTASGRPSRKRKRDSSV